MKELELKERSSKSLLANVLDIEDDFRNQGLNTSQTAIGARYVDLVNLPIHHPSTGDLLCHFAVEHMQLIMIVAFVGFSVSDDQRRSRSTTVRLVITKTYI